MSTTTAFVLILFLMIVFAVVIVGGTLLMKEIYKKLSKTYSLRQQEKWFNSLYEGEKQIVIKYWKDNTEIKKLIPSRNWKKVIELSESHLNKVLKQRRR